MPSLDERRSKLAADLDRLADRNLEFGRHDHAERLAHKAEEVRAARKWVSEMISISNEAAGVMAFQIIAPGDVMGLVETAIAGDVAALRLVGAMTEVVQQITSAPRSAPPLCGCCPAPLKRGSAFHVVICTPDREGPQNGLGFGLCRTCSSDPGTIFDKAADALRRVWPDARRITPMQNNSGRLQ